MDRLKFERLRCEPDNFFYVLLALKADKSDCLLIREWLLTLRIIGCESSVIVDKNDYREILYIYPLEKIHEHLNGPGAQGNDDAGRSEILDVFAADVANDVNDPSENIGECLHRVDT